MKINFDEVETGGGGFAPIPDGNYLVKIESIHSGRQTRAGDEMWGLELVVTDGDYQGRKIFDNLVFSQKALWRVKMTCSRFGVPLTGEVEIADIIPRLQGRKAWADVFSEEYNGKTNNRVRDYSVADITEAASAVADIPADDLPF